MNRPEYLLALVSILVGLALADLLQGFHRLIRIRRRVRWDWLALAWAALMFFLIVQTWWAFYSIVQAPAWDNLFAFLAPLSMFVVLYLLCAAALPDAEPRDEVDLEEFYFAQRGWFFGLGAVFVLLAGLQQVVREGFSWSSVEAMRLAPLTLMLLLALNRRRAVHVAATLAATAFLLYFAAAFTLRLASN